MVQDGTGKVTMKISNLKSSKTLEKEFTLYSLKEETFIPQFLDVFSGFEDLKKSMIKEQALRIFTTFQTIVFVTDDDPNTAYIKLLKSKLPIIVKTNLKNGNSKSFEERMIVEMIVEQVDIEFEDGNIKNLFIKLKTTGMNDSLDDGIIQFRNNIPIGMSGKFSPEKLRLQTIYAYDPCRLWELVQHRIQWNGQSLVRDCTIESASFNLADLIDIRLIAEVNKENYSPANQVITLTPSSSAMMLKKEKRSKIFDIRSYTDLIGIGENEPNGLIQIEASKKIFLYEGKRQSGRNRFFGALAYIEPTIRFAKIDNHNRSLMADTLGSMANLISTTKKILNVNTIDLYRYQTHSLTFGFNLLNMSIPQSKINILLDGSLGIYRTSIIDSLNVQEGKLVRSATAFTNDVNVIPYGISLIFKFLPDSRYQVTIGYGYLANEMLNEHYKQSKGVTISKFSFDGTFRTSNNTSIFARAGFSQQNSNAKLNYIQAQVGVTLDIFKSNTK
jgi:hypothetical protein